MNKKDITSACCHLLSLGTNKRSCSVNAALTNKQVMSYFYLSKEAEVIVDASPTGLGAILLQRTPGQHDNKVIAYASRALTEVEQRYSQTEREALAIVFACEHFRLFIWSSFHAVYSS